MDDHSNFRATDLFFCRAHLLTKILPVGSFRKRSVLRNINPTLSGRAAIKHPFHACSGCGACRVARSKSGQNEPSKMSYQDTLNCHAIVSVIICGLSWRYWPPLFSTPPPPHCSKLLPFDFFFWLSITHSPQFLSPIIKLPGCSGFKNEMGVTGMQQQRTFGSPPLSTCIIFTGGGGDAWKEKKMAVLLDEITDLVLAFSRDMTFEKWD